MEQTVEDFKKRVKNILYKSEIDDLCITWLRLTFMDYGKEGARASTLLDVVQDILEN